MSPSQPENASTINKQQNQPPEEEMHVIMLQPKIPQPMDPLRPHPDQPEMGLRGGDRSRCCPGRFCFCVPCPLPCDFCII